MLKKKIVIATITLALSLPTLSSAAPLSWTQPDLLTSLTRVWDFLHGAHHGTAASTHLRPKNGAGMDPTGTPTPPGVGTNGATAPSDPPTTGQ
jgi:hypothetical protein